MITAAAIQNAITPADWVAMRPIFWTAASALVVLLIDLVVPSGARRLWCIGVAIAALVSASGLLLRNYHTPYSAFGGAFLSDGFSVLFQLVILGATILSLLLGFAFERRISPAGSVALILWAASGAMVMAGAGNTIVLFLGLELLSLSLYALCAMSSRKTAREAALKYLLLSSMASAIMLYGMALLFGVTGSLSLAALLTPPAGDRLYPIAMGLFYIGVAFKLGLVPFHLWMPDVFEGAPLPVTAFMSVATKAGMLAVLARVVYAATPVGMAHGLLTPLWVLAAISMILGNAAALSQVNLKRLLAYSGIGQIGYIVAAFAGATPMGLRYALFYLVAYLVMTLGAFSVIAALSDEADEGARVVSYAGLGYRRPLLAAAMTFFLVGLAGLPPTAGFMGKILILASTVSAGYVSLAAALIVGTAISIYAYFKVVRVMYTPLGHEISAGARPQNLPLPWIVIAICAVALFALGFYPFVPSAVLPLI
jgi:NADH-quinone oxidoreductase subunit N